MSTRKVSTRRKISAVVATTLSAALLIGGAYAWTDYSQTVTNSFNGVASNQVLLHDDFNGENKDIYVENMGDSPVFVRVKMAEYLQVGNQSQLAAYDNPSKKADPTDVTTWAMHTWGDTVTDTACVDDAHATHTYYNWVLGSKDSAPKYYLSGITESDSNGYGGLSETAFEDLELNTEITIGTITTYKRATLAPSDPMTMADYKALLEKWEQGIISETEQAQLDTPRWVLDTDGWAYWSHPLQSGKATNLLLDKVETTGTRPADNWAYNIDVQLQAASVNQLSSWFRDNDSDEGNSGITPFSLVAADVNDAAAAKKIIANPDNSVMTATQSAVRFIEIKAEMPVFADTSEPVVYAPTMLSGSEWYKSKTNKADITAIHFVSSSADVPEGGETWDASAAGNESIICTVAGNQLYISAEGASKILANADSAGMFEGFTGVTEIESLSMLSTANTTNMSEMFKDCTALETVDVSSFNTQNVTDMSSMFEGCASLKEVDVSNFETENVTDMSSMFQGCENLESLDISNFNTDNVTEKDNMVTDCGTNADSFTITVADSSMKNWVEDIKGFDAADSKFVSNAVPVLASGENWYQAPTTKKETITEIRFVDTVTITETSET
jgi:surface protein